MSQPVCKCCAVCVRSFCEASNSLFTLTLTKYSEENFVSSLSLSFSSRNSSHHSEELTSHRALPSRQLTASKCYALQVIHWVHLSQSEPLPLSNGRVSRSLSLSSEGSGGAAWNTGWSESIWMASKWYTRWMIQQSREKKRRTARVQERCIRQRINVTVHQQEKGGIISKRDTSRQVFISCGPLCSVLCPSESDSPTLQHRRIRRDWKNVLTRFPV